MARLESLVSADHETAGRQRPSQQTVYLRPFCKQSLGAGRSIDPTGVNVCVPGIFLCLSDHGQLCTMLALSCSMEGSMFASYGSRACMPDRTV